MTIRPGEEWGTRVPSPDTLVVAEDDHDAATHAPGEPFALVRGDMHRALGHPGLPRRNSECTRVSIDALECTVHTNDGTVTVRLAFSSVTVGSWWRGEHTVVSNSGFLGDLNIAPRSHPNDGVAEVFRMDGRMSFKQRLIARRRARTGTHLPHPLLSVSRGSSVSLERRGPRERLSLDGRAVTNWSRVDVKVIPDHWMVLL